MEMPKLTDLDKEKQQHPERHGVNVQDKAFYIEVRTILNQVRSGTFVFFNAPLAENYSVPRDI